MSALEVNARRPVLPVTLIRETNTDQFGQWGILRLPTTRQHTREISDCVTKADFDLMFSEPTHGGQFLPDGSSDETESSLGAKDGRLAVTSPWHGRLPASRLTPPM